MEPPRMTGHGTIPIGTQQQQQPQKETIPARVAQTEFQIDIEKWFEWLEANEVKINRDNLLQVTLVLKQPNNLVVATLHKLGNLVMPPPGMKIVRTDGTGAE